MRSRFLHISAALALSALICLASAQAAPVSVLKSGAKGQPVFDVQISLFQLGFLSVAPSGVFDTRTLEAVKKFQASQGLSADGAVGSQTWQRLQAVWNKAPKKVHVVQPGDTLWTLARKYNVTVFMLTEVNQLRDADQLKEGQKLIIPVPSTSAKPAAKVTIPPVKTDAQKAREAAARLLPAMLKWTDVDRIFTPKMVARVVDVKTGRSFRVRRLYGHNHADSEPLTAEDTATLKAIYSGRWSWSRRPVVVEVAGRRIAASINGYPHGGDTISSNNFSGHICIHFLGSRTHGSSRVDPDHQAAIKVAAQTGVKMVISH